MTNNEILNKFREGFEPEQFRRVSDNEALGLYVGRTRDGLYSFEYRASYKPHKVVGSDLILVRQYKNKDSNSVYFSLTNADLLERFAVFCQDMVDAVDGIREANQGYRAVCDRFLAWKKLFKPSAGNLSEPEIMGLVGELLFLRDWVLPRHDEYVAVESWTGPERTRKDFSVGDVWAEVKAVAIGKESVGISSIEQLDAANDGSLVVYQLERMSANYNGVRLNALVDELLGKIKGKHAKELFLTKLADMRYDNSPDYDSLVFDVRSVEFYWVSGAFPRLRRENVPVAVTKAQYELALAEIGTFKISTPWR